MTISESISKMRYELNKNNKMADYAVMLGDIAKSLAMIADKLCMEKETEK